MVIARGRTPLVSSRPRSANWPDFGLLNGWMHRESASEGDAVTKRVLGLMGFGVIALVVGSFAISASRPEAARTATTEAVEPVSAQLAAKAEDSCWFKVKNRSSRSSEVSQWRSISPTGAKTERLGELLIVTGGMDSAVRDDRFYGCSLFQYTQGSPVVMSAITSPLPIRADAVIPFGFSRDGQKLQQ